MAYSNINRDKEQHPKGNWLKKAVIVAGLLIVVLSSVLNIYRQWTILGAARERNEKLETRLNKIVTENKQMERQIEVASSSAYIERKAREYFGVGSENDYWLILPKEDPKLKFDPGGTEVNQKPNILKWWELFIK